MPEPTALPQAAAASAAGSPPAPPAASPSPPRPIPLAGPGTQPLPQAPEGMGGPVDARAAERLKRRLRIINNMKRIRHKIIVASGKGGVGKSTVATNLAATLAASGKRVGILDMDLTGPNVPLMLGIRGAELHETEDGLQPVQVTPNLACVSMQFLLQEQDQAVIWRGPIKMQIIGQFLGDVAWGELDYLVIDLPPGTSDEPLSVAQNIPDADGVVLVTTPQEVAVGDVRKSAEFVRKLQLPILGVVENMSGLTVAGAAPPHASLTFELGRDRHAIQADAQGRFAVTLDVFKRGGGQAMAQKLGVPFLGAVPLDLNVMHGGDEGRPFALADGDSPGKAAFRDIVARLTAGHEA